MSTKDYLPFDTVQNSQILIDSSKQPEKKASALISTTELIDIIEKAKENNTPYELLGYLWELWDTDPEHCGEPPMVRSADALTEVLKSFWEQGLEHELLDDLLYDEEGPEAEHKLWEPQPEQEARKPKNLYQLVRKALDQNRMNELIAMIQAYEDLIYGGSIEEAIMDSVAQNAEAVTLHTSTG